MVSGMTHTYIYTCTYTHTAVGQLLILNECVCPGHELRFECTVTGGGFTVWMGSVFDCGEYGNQIYLRHSQFEHGVAIGAQCNGKIIGSI